MKLKNLIINALAVVGAVVVTEKIVDVISNSNTKEISKKLLNDLDLESVLDEENDFEDLEHNDCHYTSCNHDNSVYPDIKKYENSKTSEENHTFQYTVKTSDINNNDEATEDTSSDEKANKEEG